MAAKWIVFDSENNVFDLCDSKVEAYKIADDLLNDLREEACENGWPGNVSETIGVGKIDGILKQTMSKNREDFTDEEWEEIGYSIKFAEIVDYDFVDPEEF